MISSSRPCKVPIPTLLRFPTYRGQKRHSNCCILVIRWWQNCIILFHHLLEDIFVFCNALRILLLAIPFLTSWKNCPVICSPVSYLPLSVLPQQVPVRQRLCFCWRSGVKECGAVCVRCRPDDHKNLFLLLCDKLNGLMDQGGNTTTQIPPLLTQLP